MRRPLIAATLVVAAFAAPASAALPDPWEIYHRYFSECMDCFPQVQCVNRPCEVVDQVARIIK